MATKSRIFSLALLWLSIVLSPAIADSRLPEPMDWVREFDSGLLISATTRPQRVTISAPGFEDWHLPFWLRSFAVHPAADGQSLLVSSPGGRLLSWNGDPTQNVLWVYAAPGDEIGTVSLNVLMDPGDLQPTTSHYIWISGYSWTGSGWTFVTPDDQSWYLGTDLQLERR